MGFAFENGFLILKKDTKEVPHVPLKILIY